ncbi:MAG: exosortase-associated EpsI family protein, partial [Planctomycetota bacterium]
MNKKTIVNCIVVLAVLIGGNVAVSYIRAGYEMGAVVPPESDLADASLNLGSWVGKDLPEDPRLRQILRAKSGVDRVYQNPKKGDVLVHAVWTDDYIRLHFPQQCYRESGWEMTDSKTIEVEQANGNSFPAKICNFVQDGKQIQVLYWFQLGEHVFLDRMQHRLL